MARKPKQLDMKSESLVIFDKDFITNGHYMIRHSSVAGFKVKFKHDELTARFFYKKKTKGSEVFQGVSVSEDIPDFEKLVLMANDDCVEIKKTDFLHDDGYMKFIGRILSIEGSKVNVVVNQSYYELVERFFPSSRIVFNEKANIVFFLNEDKEDNTVLMIIMPFKYDGSLTLPMVK